MPCDLATVVTETLLLTTTDTLNKSPREHTKRQWMTVRFQPRRRRLHPPVISISFMSFAGTTPSALSITCSSPYQLSNFRLLFRFHCRLKAGVHCAANDAVSAQPEDIPYRYRQTHNQRRALLFHCYHSTYTRFHLITLRYVPLIQPNPPYKPALTYFSQLCSFPTFSLAITRYRTWWDQHPDSRTGNEWGKWR